MRARLSWPGTLALLAAWISGSVAQAAPLPSWNDSPLWIEQPMYVQFACAPDRMKALAPQHPERKDAQPFEALLEGDMAALGAAGEKGAVEIVAATHVGISAEEFRQPVREWLATARHPRFARRYDELVYRPMLEVLTYLRAKGFKTFIASGGGAEFIRVFTEERYGIPTEQVVGSRVVTKYECRDDRLTLFRLPQVDFVDDGPGKPVGINQEIGRRPVAAFGNSDGDLEMPQWTTEASERRLGVVVHHTDAEREYAYDRQSHVGKLDKTLETAAMDRWTVVDMKRHWKTIVPVRR